MVASCREANVQEANRILKSKCPGLGLGDNICLVKFVVWIPLTSLIEGRGHLCKFVSCF